MLLSSVMQIWILCWVLSFFSNIIKIIFVIVLDRSTLSCALCERFVFYYGVKLGWCKPFWHLEGFIRNVLSNFESDIFVQSIMTIECSKGVKKYFNVKCICRLWPNHIENKRDEAFIEIQSYNLCAK